MNILFVNTIQSIYYNNTIDFIVYYYNIIINENAHSMSWWLIT